MIAAGASSLSAQSADMFHWPLEQLNQRLPRWLSFSGEERIRLEGFDAAGFKPDNGDAYLLQRFRLNMKIQPAGWLKVFVQTQDARVFWKNQVPAPPFQDTWDLRLAYAEAGDMEKSPVALRFGRQEIKLGEERLVGDAWWGNTPRSFDAARLALHYRKVRLDAFASSVVVLQDGQVGSVQPGNNLHGVYGGLINVVPNSTIEPYVLWRLQPRVQSELGGAGNLDMKVSGVRWVGTLPHNFDYRTEVAFETGRLAKDHIHAWAGHWVAGYTFSRAAWKPRLLAEYNYATGDGNSRDGRRNTFDQLYPSAHDMYGLADQVGWKNIHHLRGGVEWKVTPAWSMASRYSDYWLADAHDALYNTASAVVARSANGSAGRWVGQEIDFESRYQPFNTTQIGVGLAHIFPGTFLKLTTPGRGYTGPYVFFNSQF
jgi:alginate export protein